MSIGLCYNFPMQPPQSISISTATFIKAVLIVLGVWFLWFVRDIVAIFVAAILLSSLIDPFAHWLSERRIPRGLSVLIVYTILLAIMTFVVVSIIPAVLEQGGQLTESLAVYYLDASESIGQVRQFSHDVGLADNFASSVDSFSQGLADSFGSLFSTVKGVVGGVAALLIVLVLAFYMVVEEEKMSKYFKNLAPVEYRPYVVHLMKKMQLKLGQWMRAQIILALVVGGITYLSLLILGVPYALLLALIAGLLEVVPYVGPIISLVPAAIIGFSVSPVMGVAVMVVYLVVQQLENNVLVPKIMQKVTGLNPIISILALLIGIKVAGLMGAILSIPLAMIIVVIVEDLFRDVKE